MPPKKKEKNVSIAGQLKKHLLLRCSDSRLNHPINRWLQEKNLLDICDFLAYPGGCKKLVSPSNDTQRECVLDDIAVLARVNKTQKIILANHTDCKAYGGTPAFPDIHTEKNEHTNHLREASSILKKAFPEIENSVLIIELTCFGTNFIEI